MKDKSTGSNTKREEDSPFPKMDIHFFTLSFKGDLETEFCDDYFKSNIRLIRILYFAGLFFYSSFAILDILVLPEIKHKLFVLRFLVVAPTILILIALSFTKNFKNFWQPVTSIGNTIAGIAIVIMTIISPEIARNDYYVGIILVLIYCYMLLKLRFIWSSIAGMTIVITYILSLFIFPGVDSKVITINIFFLLSVNALGMFGGYALEYHKRRDFFYRHLLKMEQEKVKLANTNLEEKVQQKTAELRKDISIRKKTEKELIKAKEKAEESDRLKSAFLANVSHEIRTPMNGILGFSSLLRSQNLSGEKQKEYIDIIKKSGDRMLTTLDDLINVSKIEAGLMKINTTDENINDLLTDLLLFFKPEAEGKGLNLIFNPQFSHNDIVINTDREKLTSILTNLIKNAIKYTDEGNIIFGYKFLVEDTISKIEFFVKDTGIGIPKERQKAIFDRFIRADSENKKVHEGFGLGLAISKSYTEMLGGNLWLNPDRSKGSEFRFSLPLQL